MTVSFLLRLVIVSGVILASGTALAGAQLPSPTPAPPIVGAADQPAHINQLKTAGTAELDRRLGLLEPQLDKLATLSQAAGTERSALRAAVQAEITAETQLKTQLSSRTSLDLTRSDVQQIINDYRTFGILLPFAQTAVATDNLTVASRSLKTATNQLGTKRQALVGAGRDTAALDQAITSARIKLATATTGITTAVSGTSVIPQSSADYGASHQALDNLRIGLQSARTDLAAAQSYVTAGNNSIVAAKVK